MATKTQVLNKQGLHSAQAFFVILALLLVIPGCLSYFEAAAQGHIRQADGTVASLEGDYEVGSGRSTRHVRGSRSECEGADLCGDYQFSILTIYEDSVEYHIDPSSFQPTLPRWFAEGGEGVHLWYTSGPLAPSQIVAITLHGKMYTSDGYVHPQAHSQTTAIWATILFLPGLGLLLFGIFLPRIALRRSRLAEGLKLNTVPSQRRLKYKPIRPATGVAKGTPAATRRRARR